MQDDSHCIAKIHDRFITIIQSKAKCLRNIERKSFTLFLCNKPIFLKTLIVDRFCSCFTYPVLWQVSHKYQVVLPAAAVALLFPE